MLLVGAHGQIGETLCACQPSIWDINLNFALSCDDETFVVGPGIEDTACIVAPRQENVTDFDFLQVSLILITERDQERNVINERTILPGPLNNGDSFSYSSYIDGNTDFNTTTLPREIQFDFNGINMLGQLIRATWSLEFTNDCTVFPVVEAGDQTIISSITDVADPPGALCPISTVSPSSVPSTVPSTKPSSVPTTVPSTRPSLRPSSNPSNVPTSSAPSSSPTRSASPTSAPPVVGVDICGCQPGSWEFMLDFNLNCDNATFQPSDPGIFDTACQLFAFDGDAIFQSVNLITILELNQNLDVESQVVLQGPMNDGDTFSYTSILDIRDSFNATSLPRAIQLTILGLNSNGNTLVATWGLEFTNNCTIFPIVTDADETVIVLGPSNQPSAVPTGLPTVAPTSSPTEAVVPTQAPTQSPTFEPTPSVSSDQPSEFPSDIPSFGPTDFGTAVPTGAPSEGPTTEMPSQEPPGPTFAPTELPSLEPTCPPIATNKPTRGKKSSMKSGKKSAGKKSTGKKSKGVKSMDTKHDMESSSGKKNAAYSMRIRGLQQQREDDMFHFEFPRAHHETHLHHHHQSGGRDLGQLYWGSPSMSMKMTKSFSPTLAPTCPDPSMKSKKKSSKSGKRQ
eukprot:CAMPEP_0168754478 /NCGR_PEP_ID=MMETSP0724-20121128/19525_1 /TAXON_ID=265536 /ORGANISM="Amphiprora sp., Strain CCMP467" /LENGTH=624 /DNA_ID=CAMNT_0008802965 /DNA_START=199 /DNA_END=2073 /DNA_ORIENTATION=+